MLLVDTSEFAGIADCKKLRAQGAEAMIPRGSSGPDHVDKLVKQQIAAAHDGGLAVPALYHYLYSWRSGALQAEHAHRTMCALGVEAYFLDIEKVMVGERPEDAPAIARVTAHDFLRRWLDIDGRRCGIYGPISYIAELKLDAELCGPLWGALTRKDGAPHPGPVPPVKPFAFAAVHQYQHNVRVPGLHGGTAAVDWNRSHLSLDELRDLLGTVGRPSVPGLSQRIVEAGRERTGRTDGELRDLLKHG